MGSCLLVSGSVFGIQIRIQVFHFEKNIIKYELLTFNSALNPDPDPYFFGNAGFRSLKVL
jgi:hypothetical protein